MLYIDCGNVFISTDLEVLKLRHQEFDVILARNTKDEETNEIIPEWVGFKGVHKEDALVQQMRKYGFLPFEL